MSLHPVLEVLLVTLRRPAALLFGVLLAGACTDPGPSTGTLVVSMTGLPTGATAAVRITGPNQFFQLVQFATTIENLVPGEYIINRDSVLFANTRYGVAQVRDTVTITRGRRESITASYLIASGSLTVSVNGLPTDVGANLWLRGPLPEAAMLPVVASSTRTGLRPGQYELRADTLVTFMGDWFAAAKLRDTIAIPASLTPVEAGVSYTLASGTLAVTVNGLPTSVGGSPITISGPNAFEFQTAQSVTLRGLAAGTYSVAATNVNGACPDIYTTSNSPQARDVVIGSTANASVDYTQSQVSAANLNLKIDKVYVTQATQNSDGTVPLISGKTALVRVFGVANQCNSARPKVRVTVSGGTPVVIDAQEDSVRVVSNEGSLLSTWNVTVPGSVVQPGMTVVAEMDVTNATAEANEGDNNVPPTGAQMIDVRTAPVVGLRFVPVAQTVNNVLLTGNVTTSNLDQWMDWPRKLHPVGTYDVDIRETYTTSSAALQANSASTWSQVLSEISALRTSDQPATGRYYYGVARVNYSAGIAGIAYVGGKTGMGWDYLDRAASRIFAHELGHNFGRFHSPCDVAGDLEYPYAGGTIGVFGWDPIEGLKAPNAFTDVMGYCRTQWISDFTYLAILNWLLDRPTSLPSTSSSAEQPSLLVWGRIENGVPILEPTFEVSARPQPPAAGPHRITAVDAGGAQLFSVSFSADRIADLPGEHETFAFTLPLSTLRGRRLASLSLTAHGRTVSSVASSDVAADPAVVATQAGPRAVRLRWNAARFPVVMVRNPSTGQVLSFARGGDATIATGRTELELNFSNRVGSSRSLKQFK